MIDGELKGTIYSSMKKNRRKYIYSNKKHTERGIFSTVLAVISCISLILTIVFSYAKQGEAPNSYGAVAFLCTVFSGIGIIIGVLGKQEEDKFYLFSYIGIVWNVLDLLFVSAILYAGI